MNEIAFIVWLLIYAFTIRGYIRVHRLNKEAVQRLDAIEDLEKGQ